MDGILNVYKEPGFTSFDVVAKLRGICRQKKIGHTGTLDPAASGVLPVCLGNATKLCGLLTEKTKQYRAVMRLGVETDTQDMTGRILRTMPPETDEAAVRAAARSFVGEYEQVPPMYSALKVNGKKLCDLARAGREVERKSRPVTILSLEIAEMALPLLTMDVVCSKGTYIRTLCHDIGQRLGCGGAMESLVRTGSGQFTLEEAHTLAQIEALAGAGRLGEILIPTDSVFSNLPAARVRKEAEKAAVNGNPLSAEDLIPAGQAESALLRDAAADGTSILEDESGAAGFFLADEGSATGFFLANEDGAAGFLPADESNAADGERLRVYGPDGAFLGIYGWEAEKQRFRPLKMFLGKDG